MAMYNQKNAQLIFFSHLPKFNSIATMKVKSFRHVQFVQYSTSSKGSSLSFPELSSSASNKKLKESLESGVMSLNSMRRVMRRSMDMPSVPTMLSIAITIKSHSTQPKRWQLQIYIHKDVMIMDFRQYTTYLPLHVLY